MTTITAQVINDITLERIKQDAQWGGPDKDDMRGPRDWVSYTAKQLGKADDAYDPTKFTIAKPDYPTAFAEWRSRMVKVAALAIAALEAGDRVLEASKAVEQE